MKIDCDVTKKLYDMDLVYNNKTSRLSPQEKVAYCEQLIDKAQLTLMRNKKLLNETIRNQIVNIIEAARQEIRELEKNKNDSNLF